MTEEHEQKPEIEPDQSDEQQAEAPQAESDFEPTTESVVEAVLFASDESLSAGRLADIVGTSVKQIRKHIESLNGKYKAGANAFDRLTPRAIASPAVGESVQEGHSK